MARTLLPAPEDPGQHPLLRLYRRLACGRDVAGLEGAAADVEGARTFMVRHDAQGFFLRLPDAQPWQPLRAMAQEHLRRIAVSNLELFGWRDRLAEALRSAAIPFAWIKGMAIAEAIYPHAGWRRSADLDLLVPADHRREALACAAELGWTRDNRSPAISERTGKACMEGAGPLLELHWRLTHPAKFPFPSDPFGEDLVDVRNARLRPAAEWVYLAVHNAQHLGLCRLAWVLDLAYHPAGADPALRAAADELAGRCGLIRTVAFSRQLAAELFSGQPVSAAGELPRGWCAGPAGFAVDLDQRELEKHRLSYFWSLMDHPVRQMPVFLVDLAWRKAVGGAT